MRPLALIVAVACTGSPPVPEPTSATAESSVAAATPEQALLDEGPPAAAGPHGRALEKVATSLGVGMVRCPLAGGGKARQRYGTPRDQVPALGPMLLLDVDPATEPPWEVIFDAVAADEEWVTMLAVPGATRGWIETRKRVIELDFPAPAPGGTSYCTAVREAPFRAVRGRVDLSGTTTPTFAVPCVTDPPPVGGDGTFVLDVPTPCTLWVESLNRRSDRVRIEPGEGAADATFVLGPPDTLQRPDRTFTDEGKGVVRAHLARMRERHATTVALVEGVIQTFDADPPAQKVATLWKRDLWEWNIRIDHAAVALDRTPMAPLTREPSKH